MAKKKAEPKKPPENGLRPKLIQFPQDWIERIDAQRGGVSFSDFVRQAVLDKIDSMGLSEVPGWGQGRWKKDA